MFEIRDRPDDIPVWHRALGGEMPDWASFLGEFSAAVDWPASAFWPELAAAFPEALIVLSTRDAEAWWKSATKTIFPASFNAPAGPWRDMVFTMFERRFTTAIDDHDAAIAAFEAHNAHVRATAPRARLLEWTAADGWEPLCAALGMAVPPTPFPHDNSTAEFLERVPRAAAAPEA
jgi:hypothetical protein